jgi:hypothetical protein
VVVAAAPHRPVLPPGSSLASCGKSPAAQRNQDGPTTPPKRNSAAGTALGTQLENSRKHLLPCSMYVSTARNLRFNQVFRSASDSDVFPTPFPYCDKQSRLRVITCMRATFFVSSSLIFQRLRANRKVQPAVLWSPLLEMAQKTGPVNPGFEISWNILFGCYRLVPDNVTELETNCHSPINNNQDWTFSIPLEMVTDMEPKPRDDKVGLLQRRVSCYTANTRPRGIETCASMGGLTRAHAECSEQWAPQTQTQARAPV